MPAIIELTADKLNKRFQGNAVLNALSFELEQGDFVLLLGANGAGKSTFLRVCANLLRPDSGSIAYQAGAQFNARQLGFLGHALQIYDHLTVRENLLLFAKLREIKLDIRAVIEAWSLVQVANSQVAKLSRGLKQRAALAVALMHKPSLILLDEPSTALDAQGSKALRQLLIQQQKSSAVMLATHDISCWSDCASRIVLLDSGRISLDTRELKKHHPSESLNALKERVISAYRQENK